MWHHNKKNPMDVNTPKAPAKPAAPNATAQASKDSSASLKFATPEIRVGLAAASKPPSSMIKMVGTKKNPTLTNQASMPKEKKVLVGKVRIPKVKKPKV
jgi:hypothetical protein